MPIDFFETGCQQNTSSTLFGLCDEVDVFPEETPAYIDETNSSEWIAEVSNPGAKQVIFTAIDHCIEILREDGSRDNKCDCMLTYSDSLVFVELKNRRSGGWVATGLNQLTRTIEHFRGNNDVSIYLNKDAYISNNLRPKVNNSYRGIIIRFKEDTGFNLSIKRDIEI